MFKAISKFFGDDEYLHNLEQKEINRFFEHHSMGDLLPYDSYDSEFELYKNKSSIGYVFEIPLIIGSSQDAHDSLVNIFKGVVKKEYNPNLQFLLISSDKIDEILNPWEAEQQNSSKVLRQLAKYRSHFIRRLAHKNPNFAPMRNFYLIVSYSEPWDFKEKPQLSKLDLDRLSLMKESIFNNLKSLGIEKPHMLSPPDLILSLRELLQPNGKTSHDEFAYNPFAPISSQVMDMTKITNVTDDVIEQGDHFIQTFGIKGNPRYWHMAAMSELLGALDGLDRDSRQITCPFFIHYGVKIPDISYDNVTGVGAKAYSVKQAAQNAMTKQLHPDVVKEADDWEFAVSKLEEGHKICEVHMTIGLMGKCKERNKNVDQLKAVFQKARLELTSNKYLQLPALISSLPCI